MMLTEPEGTGKTYVVKAIKKVMKHYSAEHCIKFMALFKSAADLI